MKASWALGVLFTAVLGLAGLSQTGLLGSQSAGNLEATAVQADQNGIFETPAGWRYQRGQPSHWKHFVMKH